jgi:outer membrane protein assembly factor BamB
LVWKVDSLGRGWSSPIIVRDRLYVTGDVDDELRLYAFDLDGQPIWRSTNGRAWTGSYPGARGCCAYSEGKLYHLNAHGRVACLDAAGGKEQWSCDLRERFQTPKIRWGLSECPLVDRTRVIVTPSGGKALIVALDKNNGQTEWATPPLADDPPTYSSTILFRHAGRRVLANCTAEHGFGVDADTGELLWTIPLRNRFGTTPTRPVYGDGRVFYVTAYTGGSCWELRPDDGGFQVEKAWETTLDTCTGTVLLKDGRLYGSGYREHKSWLCLDWTTGQVRYESDALPTSAAVYAQGRLYCLAEDGQVALLKPTDEQFELAGQFRLPLEKARDAWAHPVLLDGRLYLRYHDSLWCYDVATP